MNRNDNGNRIFTTIERFFASIIRRKMDVIYEIRPLSLKYSFSRGKKEQVEIYRGCCNKKGGWKNKPKTFERVCRFHGIGHTIFPHQLCSCIALRSGVTYCRRIHAGNTPSYFSEICYPRLSSI